MTKTKLTLAIAWSLLLIDSSWGMSVDHLRCENLINPLGMEQISPRLSWIDDSPRRGDEQTAYELIVASSADLLAKDQGDLWAPGKISSDETVLISYAGTALVSRETCYWKVRVWDKLGQPSPWSATASWEMGLLKPEDWTARWLEATPVASSSAIPPVISVVKAMYGTGRAPEWVDVTTQLAGQLKQNQLTLHVGNADLGVPDPAPNKVKKLHVDYLEDGRAKAVTVEEGDTLTLPGALTSLPYLRKGFSLSKTPQRARLYVTALGLYEVHLNGKRVGDAVLAPDWTDYNKRIRYQTYDVTELLKTGNNVLGGWVANGWYAGHLGNGGFHQYGKIPALLAQLEVLYSDGSHETIVTDEGWKAHSSPLLSTDFMAGESYDAQKEIAHWDEPGMDDSSWLPTTVRAEGNRLIQSPVDQPVRYVKEMPAQTMTEPLPGHYTFDLGQNMVGVVRIKIQASPGTMVTIRHAEMLNEDHSIYTKNLRGAASIDTYICRGDGVETWQPRFTFHGFRYVELTGLSAKPDLAAVTGVVLASDTPRIGTFTCSDPQLNQLMSNIEWGQRGNYLSVPTDCPQRDERLGWMGDAQVFVHTATYLADVEAFFSKWLVDVDDAQTTDGAFTDVSPARGVGAGTPAWGDAGVICPWTIYEAYGDRRLLEENLPAMIRWVEWCKTHSTHLLRDKDLGGNYGDWLSIGANTPKDLIGTAYFAYSTSLVAKACEALGKKEEAAQYQSLFTQIKEAFNQRYVKPNGEILGDTQCADVMALRFNLLPEETRPLVVQRLADDIAAKGNHLSTGFVGVSYLLPVLSQGHKLETAYALLFQDTFPSWLFSVKHGATTIWERWDGWTPEKGFQNPGMNSFNHYSLGSCGEWLYNTVGGLDQDPEIPGFKHLLIHPQPGGRLTSAKVSLSTVHGMAAVSWVIDPKVFTLQCTIPANTSATVSFPVANPAAITEGGKSVQQNPDFIVTGSTKTETTLTVGSGTYQFSCQR